MLIILIKNPMTENLSIKMNEEIIMRAKMIRRIRFVLASPILGIFVVLLLAIWADIIISFGDVMDNTLMHSNLTDYFSYLYSSFIHSRAIVQVVGFLMMFSGLAVIINLLKILRKRSGFRLYNFSLHG